MRFDAIVIGGGADALVTAHMLVRARRNVLLVHETAPAKLDSGWVPPRLVGELGLQLNLQAPDPWASVLLPDGERLELWRDVQHTSESLRRLSARDAQRWPEFCRRIATLAALFEKLYTEPPVDPLNLRLAVRVRGLGRQGMEDLMRVLPMSVAELLDDWFECDALKGALGAMGILHIQQGPRSGGTAFRFLHHHVGSPAGVFRPPRSDLGAALLRKPGVTVRQAKVEKILIKGGAVSGIVLAGGEEIPSAMVVSGAPVRRTLLELADPSWLDPELVRTVLHIRSRGVAARIGLEKPVNGNLVLAPSLDYLERAYDHVKYGRVSDQPYLEAAGAEVHFQFSPQAGNADLSAAVRRLLPGVEVRPAAVRWPTDLEREEGWPQGQPYDAELALDQALWMRPLPELAQYKTPIHGLWLCGPGTHPGGGIAGASGYNCARAILKEKGQ